MPSSTMTKSASSEMCSSAHQRNLQEQRLLTEAPSKVLGTYSPLGPIDKAMFLVRKHVAEPVKD